MTNNYLSAKWLSKAVCFNAFLAFFATQVAAQNDYTVTPIPHQAYSATLAVTFNQDDMYSEIIPLTFDFTFFGVTYNQVIISTNGYVNFTTTDANYYSPWAFNSPVPSPSFPVKNSVLGCYHDIYNSQGDGTVTYGVQGTAPYRKFVVLYNNISHFQCIDKKSSFQIVLYETLNIFDSQIISKELCDTWNAGAAVIGIVNADGTMGYTPPNRNTGQWIADHEGWRFAPPQLDTYNFTKCDLDVLDGIDTFNLQVAQNDLLPTNPTAVSFYLTESDAISQSNPLPLSYTNETANLQTIYANVNGVVKVVFLRVVDCDIDYDNDTVASADEDLNADTNLANDDTDGDGIANFIDNDDDGDLILTNEEYVFNRSNTTSILDTDSDGIPNYLDNDDDGDGVLTMNEDANGNHNPADDDTDGNGTPDYLQNPALANANFTKDHDIVLYPNPASSILHIDNRTGQTISEITVYAINGTLVKTLSAVESIPVSDLQSGIYFVKIVAGNEVLNYKFVRK